jgi:dienelactone hydrolase
MNNSIIKKVFLSLFVIIIIVVAGFIIWGSTPQGPMPDVEPYLISNNSISVTTKPWLTFTPNNGIASTGFIFYPGGHVNYKAYAPAAYQLAEKGILVTIVPMPLSLAVMNPGAAKDVISSHPEIKHWVIGGHSLGGVMAANYAYSHPGDISGLVLWAAYPAQNNSLNNSTLPVISIYGSQDGMVTELEASSTLLPPTTEYIVIKGGNHAQMGWYGKQAGDNEATISRNEQQAILINSTWNFIRGLE